MRSICCQSFVQYLPVTRWRRDELTVFCGKKLAACLDFLNGWKSRHGITPAAITTSRCQRSNCSSGCMAFETESTIALQSFRSDPFGICQPPPLSVQAIARVFAVWHSWRRQRDVKSKMIGSSPYRTVARLALTGLWVRTWIHHHKVWWRMASALPALRLPFRLQSICAVLSIFWLQCPKTKPDCSMCKDAKLLCWTTGWVIMQPPSWSKSIGGQNAKLVAA